MNQQEKTLTINNKKLTFVKKISSMLYPVKRISRAIVQETPNTLSGRGILSASTAKRLGVELLSERE